MFKLFNKSKNTKNDKSAQLPQELITAMKNAPENATIICCNFIYSSRDVYNNATLTNYKDDDKKIVGSMPRTVVYVPTAAKEKYFDTSSYEGRFYFRDFMELVENELEDELTDNNSNSDKIEDNNTALSEETNNDIDNGNDDTTNNKDSDNSEVSENQNNNKNNSSILSENDDKERIIANVGVNPEPPFER